MAWRFIFSDAKRPGATWRPGPPRRLGWTFRREVGGPDQIVEGGGDGLVTADHHMLVAKRHLRGVWPMRSISSRVFAPAARAKVAAEWRKS